MVLHICMILPLSMTYVWAHWSLIYNIKELYKFGSQTNKEVSTVSTFEHSRCHGLTDDGNGLPFRQPPAGRDERRALADHLAEALWHGAMHLALAAGELLGLADAGAVVAAEAEALERVALRQAVPLLRDDPCRHGLCSTHAWRGSRFHPRCSRDSAQG